MEINEIPCNDELGSRIPALLSTAREIVKEAGEIVKEAGLILFLPPLPPTCFWQMLFL